MPQDAGGSISAAGSAMDVPDPEAHAEALGTCGLGKSHLHKDHPMQPHGSGSVG